jgi:hypothetical protein
MRDGHTLLQDCLKDLHAQKPIGRPVGASNKPMPPKEGPVWEEFVAWFTKAPIPTCRRADLWRAFWAGAECRRTKSPL